jgi:hydroxymethylbilane synthase
VRAGLLARADLPCEIVVLKTTGDRIQDRPLADSGGKGLFTKELEEALLRGDIDLAVHSMKDVPTKLPARLEIAAILEREDPRDVFVSPLAQQPSELPNGARVGTSSVRRTAQLLRARPDAKAVLLRGNIDTRLRKLEAGEYHAIILALAGLRRIGQQHRVTAVLEGDSWLPALAQGAMGIEIRDDDVRTREAVRLLNHQESAIAIAFERAFQDALDGSCRTPIAGLAEIKGRTLAFRGEVLSPDGRESAGTRIEIALGPDPVDQAARAGREAGLALKPRAARWLAI